MVVEANALSSTRSGDVGDALEKFIPLATLAATIAKRDYQGSKEFSKGLLATLGTTYAMKGLISKERPDGRDDNSFPSGHTAVSFHAASFVHERYGWRWALPMYLTAAWVGHSRVHDDRHDEEDVVVGALLGYAAARYFTTEYQGLEVKPALAEGYVGLSMSFTY